MRQKIPTYTPAKRKRRLSDKIDFKTMASPKKSKKPKRPSQLTPLAENGKPSPKEKLHRGLAKGLATASAAMPGGGYGGIIKAGLAGAAAGSEIEASYHKYKAARATSKAKKATTTVTQSAMAQKAKYHKKDPTKTKRT